MNRQVLTSVDNTLQPLLKTLGSATKLDSAQLIKTVLEQVNDLQKSYSENSAVLQLRVQSLSGRYPSLRRALNSLSLVLLFASKNRISDTVAQHILTGCVLAASVSQRQSIETQREVCRDYLKRLSGPHFALVCWTLNRYLHTKSPLLKSSSIVEEIALPVGIALEIARVTSSSSPESSRSTLFVIQQLLRKHPSTERYIAPVLSPDSEVWIGHLFKSGSKKGLFMGADAQQLYVAVKHSDTEQKGFTLLKLPIETFYNGISLDNSAPPKSSLNTYLHLIDMPDFQPVVSSALHYSVQHPPAELIAILAIINKGAEPAKIAKVVAQNALFSTILQRSASQLTRLNINVTNIVQSIMTHGTERIAAVLTEHILWQRLSYSNFPLQRHFCVFAALHRFISAQIAQHCRLGIAQQFSLYGTFHLSALFTSPTLRVITEWHKQSDLQAGTDSMFSAQHAPEFSAFSEALAKAWRHAETTSNPLYSDVNTIALYLTRMWLHEGRNTEREVFTHLRNECKRIHLSIEQINTIRQEASEMLVSPI